MGTTDTQLSPAFKQLLEQSNQHHKKYAKNLGSNHTDEHRLLDERAARESLRSRNSAFLAKVAEAVERRDVGTSKLSLAERRAMQLITGSPGRKRSHMNFSCVASNPHARDLFFDEAYLRLKAIYADVGVTTYFATIVDKSWCLAKDAKSFDVKSMIHRAKRALRDIGYHGILFLEIQAVVGLPEAKFLPHLHGFVWRKNAEGLSSKEAMSLLNKRFEGIRKAKGVTLRVMPKDKPKSLPTRFFYATKMPDTAKSYCPMEGSEDAFVQEPNGRLKTAASRNYTDSDALMIALFWAQYEIDDTVFAVGDGTLVRKAASKALTAAAEKTKGMQGNPCPDRVLSMISKLRPN
jgi:hypothetical protein